MFNDLFSIKSLKFREFLFHLIAATFVKKKITFIAFRSVLDGLSVGILSSSRLKSIYKFNMKQMNLFWLFVLCWETTFKEVGRFSGRDETSDGTNTNFFPYFRMHQDNAERSNSSFWSNLYIIWFGGSHFRGEKWATFYCMQHITRMIYFLLLYNRVYIIRMIYRW